MLTGQVLQNCAFAVLVQQGGPALAQAAVLALGLGRQHQLQLMRAVRSNPGLHQQGAYASTSGSGPCDFSASGMSHSSTILGPHFTQSGSGNAHLHSAALLDNGSDEDAKAETPGFNAQLFPPHYSNMAGHQHHHAGHSSHHHPRSQAAKAAAAAAAARSQHHHHPHRQAGELHAAHGRRHAASSSGGQPDALSELLLSCKGLGVLRRVMLKYKANMSPQHVANTLVCLQHFVLEARQVRRSGSRRGGGVPLSLQHPAEEEYAAELQQLVQQRRGGVRAAQDFSRATARAAESDGPHEQLVAQMLGELGNMIWHMMGDMSAADLAKLLYSWARMEWHPEQKLLADVAASFLAAVNASASSTMTGYIPGYIPAAGLWGLAKLGEPFTGPTLALLRQHWQAMLPHWSQQQLADLAWALAAAADEIMAAETLEQQQGDLQHLAPLVLGLADRMVQFQQQQQQQQQAAAAAAAGGGAPSAGSSSVQKVPWPEVLLKETPAVPAPSGAVVPGGRPAAPPADAQQVAAAAAWRMLQSLAAVGVNVSEPQDPRVGEMVAVLSAAMQQQQPRASW